MNRILWHNFPLLIDVFHKIEPRRILDVNFGFGHWGMIIREIADPGRAYAERKTWTTCIHGLKLSDREPAHPHEKFYDKIIAAKDANEAIRKIDKPYNLILIGDLLRRTGKKQGLALLRESLDKADYILLNFPLCTAWSVAARAELARRDQDETDGADGCPAPAKHDGNGKQKETLALEDFAQFPVVRKLIFQDDTNRSYASLVLSLRDPKLLGQTAPCELKEDSEAYLHVVELTSDVQKALAAIRESKFELEYMRRHPAYQFGMKMLHSRLWRTARWLRNRNRNLVWVRALEEKNPASEGYEAWLVGARHYPDSTAIPWDFMEPLGKAWQRKTVEDCPYQQCFVATSPGLLRFPLCSDQGVLEFITHPWSGKVEVSYLGRRQVVDLYSAVGGRVRVWPSSGNVIALKSEEEQARELVATFDAGHGGAVPVGKSAMDAFSGEEKEWLRQIQAKRVPVLAVHVPRWLGITNSTRVLFEHTLPFPKTAGVEPYNISATEIAHQANLIVASGVKHVVCSGGDEIHYKMVREIKRKDPTVRCDVLLHASYLHFSQDYNWRLMQAWISGQREGLIHTIGTVKKGMEEFFEQVGCRSRFVMNYIPQIPDGPSEPLPGGPHLGIWSSGENPLKPPYAMLAAVRMTPNAVLHGSGFVDRVREVVDFFQIPTETFNSHQVPFAELMKLMGRTHLNLYASFTECCPMLPLESFSVGTPCLLGPCSHLFEDDEYLHGRLVVPYPDRAEVIARHIAQVLEEREQVVRAYIEYAREYNQRARESVCQFLAD